MKRRPVELPESVAPHRLRRFDPADWPADACHPECAFWQAHREWDEQHPVEDRGFDIENAPDEPWHPERF